MSELNNDLFVTIGELVDEPVAQTGPSGDFIYIDISSIDRETKKITETKKLAHAQAPSRAKQVLKAGDVLVSMTRPNLNAVALVPQDLAGAIGSTGFHVIRSSWLHPKYILALVQTHSFIDAMSSVVQGALYPAVRPRDVAAYRFKYDTPAQQIRIVEKLEELLTDLDSGVAELKMAQRKIAQYRQSLLKAAVAGELTAQWRENNPATESGALLLERILRERRARWEAKQLAKFSELGKKPTKEWQKKYPEPVQPDITNLPPLPKGWVWASVDCLLSDIETGKSFKCEERPPHNHEVGVVKVSAVTWGEYNEEESKTCHNESMVRPELFVNTGDFLFSRANTIELVGACVIAQNVTKRVMLSDKILRLILVKDELKTWLLTLLRSELGRKYIEQLASGNQESMRNIGQKQLRQIPVPLPCMAEITEGSELLSVNIIAAKEQEKAINLSIKQSIAQRQNILRAAFSGQLVPKDSDDVPASRLLEKIKANQAEIKAKAKARKIKKSDPMNKPIAEHLNEFIKNSPENEFSFETLKRISSGDYETVKSAVFHILAAEKPIIEQIFDSESGAILFRKVMS